MGNSLPTGHFYGKLYTVYRCIWVIIQIQGTFKISIFFLKFLKNMFYLVQSRFITIKIELFKVFTLQTYLKGLCSFLTSHIIQFPVI